MVSDFQVPGALSLASCYAASRVGGVIIAPVEKLTLKATWRRRCSERWQRISGPT